MNLKETPREKRERLRQNESRNNPTGSLRDGFDSGAGNGNLSDIAGDLGWKGMGLLVIVLGVGYTIYQVFFG
ncbi:DUF6366 family protein [Planococcus shixiaomingii]|uniref:DUF6366 family protein n=1 Tax=Planococcus shixiaomingii TaxID=3058393 RepID=UPI00261A8B79|nr:DUF6366 family protein [Planococcus sp. N022]WKA56585.1 DUF6366 family protein [Planococcus sp. N022]